MERKQRQQDPRTPLPVEPPAVAPAVRPREMPPLELGPPWFGSIRHRQQVDALWLLIASAMFGAGLLFFGWRAGLAVVIAILITVATHLLVGQLFLLLRRAHKTDSVPHVILMAMLMTLSLPLLRETEMLILASALLGIVMHFVGRIHRVRIHPVALVLVLLWLSPMLFRGGAWRDSYPLLQPVRAVLRPMHLLMGDVHNHGEEFSTQTWTAPAGDDAHDAVARDNPYETLIRNQVKMLEPTFLVNMLASGELPRLEEILLGVVPGPMGGSSRGLLFLLGLYLMYRRVAWWPMGLASFLAAAGTLLLMPLQQNEQWTIVGAKLMHLEPAVAVSYIGYMLLGCPGALIALILAPITAPMSGPGRIVYGLLIGTLLIAAQWTFETPQAAFLSLLIASALARPLDALHIHAFVKR